MSDSNFDQMSPEKLIKPDHFAIYNKQLETIWLQLVQLHQNLYVIDKLSRFPRALFMTVETPFFPTVLNALYECSIMIIWRVIVDTDGDTLTIQRFKNEVLLHWLINEYREEFKRRLRDVRFDSQTLQLVQRIREIRHNYVAHLKKQIPNPPAQNGFQLGAVYLADLKQLLDAAKALFDSLCFQHQKSLWFISYSPDVIHPVGVDSRNDIDRILDSVAKDSHIMNMPEREPDVWPLFRAGLSDDLIQTLNEYRERFGLPKA